MVMVVYTTSGYVQIELEDIARIVVDTTQANKNIITLKNGERYLLQADEAQRVSDALRDS